MLVVWLKRFRQEAGAAARRIDAPVHGLEEDLDLTGHLDPAAGAVGAEQTTPASATRYRTRAIVCHHGSSLKGGHYTCWVRAAAPPAGPAEDTWVQYNDSTVGRPRNTLPPTVASDACLLFYERMRSGPGNSAQPACPVVEIDGAAGAGGVPGADGAGPETRDVEMLEDPGVAAADGRRGAGSKWGRESEAEEESNGADAMDVT